MRKALIALCVFILAVLCFSSCNEMGAYTGGNAERMTVVYNGGYVIIHRDNETGVQYISRSNCGTCVMVDKDGKPYIGGE